MKDEDIIIGEQYMHDGRVVTVCSKHRYISNHYYIEFEYDNHVDTSTKERLFPLDNNND